MHESKYSILANKKCKGEKEISLGIDIHNDNRGVMKTLVNFISLIL